MIDVPDSRFLLKRLCRDSCAPVPFAPRAQDQLDLNQGAVHGVSPAKKTCPFCGSAVAKTYCPACGQKYEDRRFTLGAVLSSLLREIVDLESGFLATVVGLSRTPGRVVRDYWARCTKPYLNPAKYFLFAATVFQLVLWQTGAANNFIEGFLAADEEISVSRARALRFLGDYFVLVFATGLPVLTVASYWGTERNLAEHTIFQLYVVSHGALLWSVLLPITMWISIPKIGYLLFPVIVAYYVWAYVTAHRPDTDHGSVRESIQALGTLVLFAVLYVFVLGVSIGLYVGIINGGAT